MKDAIVVRGARQHNLKGFDLEIPRRTLHRHHRARPARASPRSPSTPSTPRGSGGTSSRCRRTRGSSSSAWRSPTSTRSTGSRPPSRSSRRTRPRRRARPSAPRPRSTTTCACSGRASAARSVRSAAASCKPDTVQSVTDAVLALPAGTRFYVAFPLRSRTRSRTRSSSRTCARRASCASASTARCMHLDELDGARTSTSRVAKELLVVVDRLVVGADARGRLADAVGTAFREGDGDCVILFTDAGRVAVRRRAGHAASLHRALRVPERRHPRAGAHAAALLVQQPARRLPARATASARCSSTTRRSSCPTPSARCATARSIRGRSRATTTSAARSPSSRSARGSRWTSPWRELAADAARRAAARDARAATRASSRSSRDLEEKRYKQYIRVFLRQYQTRAGVSDVSRHEAQARSAAGARRRPHHRRGRASCRSTRCIDVARRRSR